MIEKLPENPLNADTNRIIMKINEVVEAVNEAAKRKPAPRKKK